MKTVAELMDELSPLRKKLDGLVRRMTVRLTSKTLWQLAGFKIDGRLQTIFAELFTGIGITARPPEGSKAEAMVINVGDADHPAIIGTRDEATRAKVAGALKADETMLFNSKAVVHVKADETVEVRKPGGIAVPLATKADLQALRDYIENTMVITCPAGTSTPGTSDVNGPPDPDGTAVLKGE